MSAAQDGRARAIEAAAEALHQHGPLRGATDAHRRPWRECPRAEAHEGAATEAIDAALADGGVVTREAAIHEREWGNAHFADWQRERDRAERLEAALRQIAAIGDVPQVNATCHWHAEAVELARAAFRETERTS